ncbi:hypothetical protein PMAYCL1PPCAC_24896 [Pristionchus mayeri]|uniref:Uncharacterized protein n=1 Tax=Pristionchus mayeri TaxID=1317129 RepID=A0AAN5D1K9_9BILA|nr:hypothetical protein PMAYCL1PPCAC_24896 [Pristionchus mayeri]
MILLLRNCGLLISTTSSTFRSTVSIHSKRSWTSRRSRILKATRNSKDAKCALLDRAMDLE